MEIKQKFNRVTRKWEPKEWHPVYEEIVVLSARGYSNTQVAHKFDISKQTVSNILNTQQGKKVLKEISLNIRAMGMTMAERRLEIANKAMERVENYFLDDEEFEKRKGPMADRAMKMLQGVGELKGENEGNTHNVMIGNDALAILRGAIDKSDLVRVKYATPVQSETVEITSGISGGVTEKS